MNTDDFLTVRNEGYFDIVKYVDQDFPGIDVEFIPNNYNGTNPRVLFEFPRAGKLRVMIWGDKDEEDYSHWFEFDI